MIPSEPFTSASATCRPNVLLAFFSNSAYDSSTKAQVKAREAGSERFFHLPQASWKDVLLTQRQRHPLEYDEFGVHLHICDNLSAINVKVATKQWRRHSINQQRNIKGRELAVRYIDTCSLTPGFPYSHQRGLSFQRGCSESLPGGAQEVIIYTAH